MGRAFHLLSPQSVALEWTNDDNLFSGGRAKPLSVLVLFYLSATQFVIGGPVGK